MQGHEDTVVYNVDYSLQEPHLILWGISWSLSSGRSYSLGVEMEVFPYIEVLVISPDLYWMDRSFQKVPPLF